MAILLCDASCETSLSDVSSHLVVRHGGRELAGAVRADESLYGGARRTSATLPGEPVPVDLFADPHVWEVDHDQVVTIRAMTHGDLPDVARWRAQPHVQRWWQADGPATLEAVTAKYGSDIDGMTPTRMWVIEANGRSVGLIQDYRVGDYPDYALLAPDPDAIGCDYIVGEPEWTGRGIGTRALWAWMVRTRHRLPGAATYFAAPDHRNAGSLRVLDKLGFSRGVWFDDPQPDGSVVTCVGCSLDVRRVLG